jgi:hypothetical protein
MSIMERSYGRGSPAKDVFQNSVSPPSPSINVNDNLNVASGRAAKVLRQIKFVKEIYFN